MKKKSELFPVSIFVVLLFAYCLSFMFLWDKTLSDNKADISDRRWLIYSAYLLSTYSASIWIPHINIKINGVHVICLLWCITMPFIILYNHGDLKEIAITLLWPLLFEASYFLVKQDKDNLAIFRKLFVAVLLFATLFFFQSRIDFLSNRLTQSNTIYFVFLTLPWLLLVKRNTSRSVLLILYTILGVWSLKRSMMLSLVFIWSLYLILLWKEKGGKTLKTVFVVILLFAGIYGFEYANNVLKGELVERVYHEETDEGGDRLAIYQITWAMIQSSSTESIFFGHGHNAVRNNSILEMSAHNDFLEIIYDYGLVILLLYLGLWVYVFRRCFSLYKIKSALAFPYTVSLIIFLVMSMVSHLVLYATYFNYLVVFWGSVEGLYYKKIRMKSLIDR